LTKDYLRATAQIEVNLGGNDEEQELPSQEQWIERTPPQLNNKARMDVSNNSFSDSRSDRSDLGMSNASSIGLPGLGTLRAGINLPHQGPYNQSPPQQHMTGSSQMSSA